MHQFKRVDTLQCNLSTIDFHNDTQIVNMKFLNKNLRAIATVNVNQDGRFSYTMGNLKAALLTPAWNLRISHECNRSHSFKRNQELVKHK